MPTMPPLLFDWANQPAPKDATSAPITNRPGAALYTQGGGTANQGGVLGLGSDYAATPRAQVPRVDANGVQAITEQSLVVAGSTVSAAYGGPLVMGLSSGVVSPLQIDALQSLVTSAASFPTFSALTAGVSITTGKSMFALVNGSTAGKVLRLVALYAVNTSTTTSTLGNTYNIYAAELRPITGVSATGTAGSIVAHDAADALDANVKCYSGATVTGDTVGPLRRWATSSYGTSTNATNAESANLEQQGRFPWVQPLGAPAKLITVRPGAGLHIKIASTATTGFLDITAIFTQASA